MQIAIGRAADHDRAIPDREDPLPALVLDAEAADDAIPALQADGFPDAPDRPLERARA
jgi:hypothetical protein